jgi:hypothetical protein
MQDLNDFLRDWQVFYATIAGVSATLMGLLFVALSLEGRLSARLNDECANAMARQTFSEFLLVLMIALVLLVPRQSPVGLGVALLALATAYAVPSGMRLLDAVRNRRSQESARFLLRVFGVSFAGCMGIVGVAIAILMRRWLAFHMLVFMLAAFLTGGSRYAWFLLTHRTPHGTTGEMTPRPHRTPPGGPAPPARSGSRASPVALNLSQSHTQLERSRARRRFRALR